MNDDNDDEPLIPHARAPHDTFQNILQMTT